MAHGTVLKVKWESTSSQQYELSVTDGSGTVLARGRYSNSNTDDLKRECDLVIEAVSKFYSDLIEWRD